MNYKAKLIALLFAFTLVLVSCKKDDDTVDTDDDNTLKIGYLMEITGTATTNTTYDILTLIADDVNAAGGINGQDIEIKIRDAFEDPAASVEAFKAEGINFLIGPGWSSKTVLAADYVSANNMLMMPTSATSPAISTLADNGLIWRSCVSDEFQAIVAADYIKNTLSKSTVAIFYQDDAWGGGLADAFETSFIAEGGTITSKVSHEALEDYSQEDYTTEAATIMADSPDLILYLSFGGAANIFLTDLWDNAAYQSSKPSLFTVEGLGVDALSVDLNAEMVEGMMGIAAVTDDDPESNFTQFETFVNASFPEASPSYYQACAYDNLYLMLYAMIKAGTNTDASLVAAELKDLSGGVSGVTVVGINDFTNIKALIDAGTAIDYDGASGRIEFDDNGDAGSGLFEIVVAESAVEVRQALVNYPQ